jgi:hypothetical protein
MDRPAIGTGWPEASLRILGSLSCTRLLVL